MKRLLGSITAILLVLVFAGAAFAQAPREIAPPQEMQKPGEIAGPREIAPKEWADKEKAKKALKDYDWDKAQTQEQYVLEPQKSACEGLERFGKLPIPNGPSPVYINLKEINKVFLHPEWTCQVLQMEVLVGPLSSFDMAVQKFRETERNPSIILQIQITGASYLFTYINAGYDRK